MYLSVPACERKQLSSLLPYPEAGLCMSQYSNLDSRLVCVVFVLCFLISNHSRYFSAVCTSCTVTVSLGLLIFTCTETLTDLCTNVLARFLVVFILFLVLIMTFFYTIAYFSMYLFSLFSVGKQYARLKCSINKLNLTADCLRYISICI